MRFFKRQHNFVPVNFCDTGTGNKVCTHCGMWIQDYYDRYRLNAPSKPTMTYRSKFIFNHYGKMPKVVIVDCQLFERVSKTFEGDIDSFGHEWESGYPPTFKCCKKCGENICISCTEKIWVYFKNSKSIITANRTCEQSIMDKAMK